MTSSKIKPIKKSRTTGWSLDKYIWYLLLLKGGAARCCRKNCAPRTVKEVVEYRVKIYYILNTRHW